MVYLWFFNDRKGGKTHEVFGHGTYYTTLLWHGLFERKVLDISEDMFFKNRKDILDGGFVYKHVYTLYPGLDYDQLI